MNAPAAPDITIVQEHTLSPEDARKAVQNVADEMTKEFDMVCEWQGDVLAFKRAGMSGTLALMSGQAQLDMTLGFMLKSFTPVIREKVAGNMRKVFAG